MLYTLNVAGNLQKEAPKLTAEMKKLGVEAERTQSKLENVAEKGLKKLGAFGGEAADAIFDFLIPLHEASAGLGGMAGAAALASGGLAAGAIAVGVAATAAKRMADAALQARDRLQAMNIEVSGQAKANLDAYAAATSALSVQVDLLTVRIGSELAPALTRMATTLTMLTDTSNGAKASLAGMGDEGRRLSDMLSGVQEDAERASGWFIYLQNILITGGGSLWLEQAARLMNGLVDSEIEAQTEAAELMKKLDEIAKSTVFTGPKKESGGRDFAREDRERTDALRKQSDAVKALEERWGSAAKAAEGYAGIVSGAGVGAGGVNLGAMDLKPFMGQQTGGGAGIQGYDSGLDQKSLDVNLSQEQELKLISSATTAMEGGIGSVLGMIPVFGGFLEGIWSFVSNFGGISMNIVDELISFIENIGDQFATIIFDVPMRIVEALPDMIASIIALIPRIIAELIASGPKLMVGLIKAIMDLPAAIGAAFAETFAQMWIDIKESINEMTKIFDGKNEQKAGTSSAVAAHESAMNPNSAFASIQEMAESRARAPRALGGGFVAQPGLAMVHRGEEIRRASDVRRGQQPVSQTFNFSIHGITDPVELMREMRKLIGSRGRGLTLDPFGAV